MCGFQNICSRINSSFHSISHELLEVLRHSSEAYLWLGITVQMVLGVTMALSNSRERTCASDRVPYVSSDTAAYIRSHRMELARV